MTLPIPFHRNLDLNVPLACFGNLQGNPTGSKILTFCYYILSGLLWPPLLSHFIFRHVPPLAVCTWNQMACCFSHAPCCFPALGFNSRCLTALNVLYHILCLADSYSSLECYLPPCGLLRKFSCIPFQLKCKYAQPSSSYRIPTLSV